MLRKLRTQDAPRPSTKLRALDDHGTIAAQNRGLEPRALVRQLRGDLDAITLKALEKERARRYGAPSELAADIERYLRHELVAARRAGAGYRAWKYMRRHRVGVGFATALALLLMAGVAVSSWMALRARRAEQEAQAVNDFLRNDVLAQASVDEQTRVRTDKPDPNLKVRTALDRAAKRIDGKFDRQPLVEASIRHTIGIAYRDMDLYLQAQPQLERALALRERLLGGESRDTLLTKRSLAALYQKEGQYAKAEKLMSETLSGLRRVLDKGNAETLNCEQDLAVIYFQETKYAEAEALDRELLSVRPRLLGGDDPKALQIEANLAIAYMIQGKYGQAQPICDKLVTALLPARALDRDTLDAIGSLAMLYALQNNFAQLEALSLKAVDGLTRLAGQEDSDTLAFMNGLAYAYDRQGKYAKADALYSQTFEADSRVLGSDHPNTLTVMTDWAYSHHRRGMYEQSEKLLVWVVDGRRRKLGDGNPDTLASLCDLGWAYVNEGRYVEAEPLVREAANTFEKAGSDEWQRYRVMCALGASLAGQEQYAKAEPLLRNGYQKMAQRRAILPYDGKFELEQAGKRIVKLYQDWRKPEKAAEWQQKLKNAGLSGSVAPDRERRRPT